jgi:hypothetical protein
VTVYADRERLRKKLVQQRRWQDPVFRARHLARYGHAYQQVRAQFRVLVERGGVRCARGAACFWAERVGGRLVGGFIRPGDLWDLGHRDDRPDVIAGPEHRRCNRATSGRRRSGSRPKSAVTFASRRSRLW